MTIRSIHALAVATLLLGAAPPAPEVAIPRLGPMDDGCEDEERDPEAMVGWAAELGGEETRKAWKELRDHGPEGTAYIAAWLAEGAPGGKPADRTDASLWILRCGEAEAWARATWLLDDATVGHGELEEAVELAGKRLAILTASQAKMVSEHPQEDVRYAALNVLIGFTKVGGGFNPGFLFFPTSPVKSSTKFTQDDERPPPAHHVAGVVRVLELGGPKEAERTARLVMHVLESGAVQQQAWFELTFPLLDPERGTQKASEMAAMGFGLGSGESVDRALRHLTHYGNADTQIAFVQGIERKLEAGRGSPKDRERLEQIRKDYRPRAVGEATKLQKKFDRLGWGDL